MADDPRTGSPEIGLFEAIYTQRAIRSFKPDPVPRELIERIVEAATKAPSGGNSQPWGFVVVQDRAMLDQLAVYAREGFEAMYQAGLARMKPGDPLPFPRLKKMIEAFEVIPAFVIVCAVSPAGGGAANLGSVYPAVQNLLLAARGVGLGAALTSGWAAGNMHHIKAMLDLPANVEPVAFIPLGYPDQERYGPTTRRPLSEVIHWDRWTDQPNTAKMSHRITDDDVRAGTSVP